jgi:hypothetical protein
MLKNLKHLIVFILIVITLLFVVIMSLAVSKPVPNINTAAVSAQNGNESKYGKWSGLGMVIFQTGTDGEYDGWVDTLLDNGFNEFRETPTYQNTCWLAKSKAAIIRNVGKGAKYIWGVSSNPDVITAANWPTFRQAILDAAQWAQDNGVYEFQLGNEEEFHNDVTTLTDVQLIANLKAVATEVKVIFTNGNVSYTCFHENIDDWVAAGKGDIDILASNIYMGGDFGNIDWQSEITNLMNAFGASGTCITEFGPSYTSLDDYSTDEAEQAEAISEMINYIKTSGMTRAFYFVWYHPSFDMGVVKDDGTYRLLWNQALLNSGL